MLTNNQDDPIRAGDITVFKIEAFYREDLLMLTNNQDDPIRAGDITVFKIECRDIPIIHRGIEVHEKSTDDSKFLTKGDHIW
ncbi:signal peptidase complex catalytic subunit SEC11C [Ditylenchus destructor]|nr:signal peptidase complex catalytic subunit SEC11C [Ditylenchus destructor]